MKSTTIVASMLVALPSMFVFGCAAETASSYSDAPDASTPDPTGEDESAAGVWPPPPNGNPRTGVYKWSDVWQWSCKVAAGRRMRPPVTDGKQVAKLPVNPCKQDSDCIATTELCDTTSGCGCCVPRDIPPVTLPANRFIPSVCETDPAKDPKCGCKMPYKCVKIDDTHCKIPAGGRVWASTYPTDPKTKVTLASALKQLCIKVEPDYDTPPYACLWQTSITTGDVKWDVRPGGSNISAPDNPPDGYECGGRTCNGATDFLGTQLRDLTYTLIDNGCTKGCGQK